ncbi:MAG: MFS transporter, partial [Alphaproteobacteria bacterium]|nr:MFS transporter [Alphaproteobacteria bacterium]
MTQTRTEEGPEARSFSPVLIVACGCLIGLLTFGPRSSIGLFQLPMTSEFGWGRDVFSFAIAIQ